MRTEVSSIQMLALVLALFLLAFLGKYLVSYIGWWGMLPAIAVLLALAFVAVSGIVNVILEWRDRVRRRKSPTRM